jgi:hypothetical protein
MQLRTTTLSTTNIFHIIDSIANYISVTSTRHYQKFGITTNFQTNINNLKSWISARLNWLDANMPGNCWNMEVTDASLENSFSVYPNPCSEIFHVLHYSSKIRGIELYNVFGERILKTTPHPSHDLSVDISNQPNGLYLLHILTQNVRVMKKIIVSK